MKKNIKIISVCVLSVLLSACGFFDKDNTPPPSTLANFTPQAKINSLWNVNTGSGVKKDYLKLAPAISEQSIFTANKAGTVTATNKLTGQRQWMIDTQTALSAGATAADNIVLVGTETGELLALNPSNGHLLWKTAASSEILAKPAAQHGIALVKSIDGKLSAFSEKDGHPLWQFQQTEPSLILRAASAPQINEDSVIVGFANGHLAKLNLQEGNSLWQATVATPEGSFAIQRMIDIDADPIIFGNRVYVATYQGQISALDLASGNEIWTYKMSSYTGMAADSAKIFISDAKSHIWAFDRETGTVSWRQTQLEFRNITAPVIMGNYIAVGDAEGYLHWLSKADGHFIARTKVNSSGILATPVVDNTILYVVTKDGHLAAYSLQS